MILTYDAETYNNAKEYLLNNMNYTTDTPKYIHNGHEFYEHYIKGWSHNMGDIYHAFCDNKNIIIFISKF